MRLNNVDGFSFDFTDAIDAFVFDETDTQSPNYHGSKMKAVDVVVELNDAYYFIEIKDYTDATDFGAESSAAAGGHFKWLKKYLKYKYRDSYLYRHAENKVDKPIHYICLLTFDNALNVTMQKALANELPVGKASKRWQRELVHSCQVVNLEKWNQNFPKWHAERVS